MFLLLQIKSEYYQDKVAIMIFCCIFARTGIYRLIDN